MLQRESVTPDETEARAAFAARARYFTPANAFDVDQPAVPAHVFVAERDRAFDPQSETGLIPLDVSARIGLDYPASTPLILARYMRIRAGESLTTELKSSTEIYYVLRGAGQSRNGGDTLPWRQGDVFCLPGGTASTHAAGDADAILYVLSNEPQLAFENTEPPRPGNAPVNAVLYPGEEIDARLSSVHAAIADGGGDVAGKVVIFSNEMQEARHHIAPTLTLAMNSLEPGGDQRAHRHNSAALTLAIHSEGCYSMLDGERCDWMPDAVMLTPPAAVHSHHNRGEAMMKSLVVQDGGIHYLCRTMDFAFVDDA